MANYNKLTDRQMEQVKMLESRAKEISKDTVMTKVKMPLANHEERRKLSQHIEDNEREAREISQRIAEIYDAENAMVEHMRAAQYHISEYRRIKALNGFGE